MQSYRFYEVRVSMPESENARSRAIGLLETCGVKTGDIVIFEPPGKIEAAFYPRHEAAVRKIKALYPKYRSPGMKMKVKVLEKEDWFDKWQLDYQMFPVGKKLMLVPWWQRKDFKPGKRLPVYLDPKGVFGSGQHPATRIMTDWVEQTAGKFESVLDLGTGTGVLSVAAFRLGAKKILAADHDSLAVRAAKFNFRANGLKNAKAVRADVTKMRAGEKYDLVCANLFTALLEQIKPFLFSSVALGGHLALCGVHVQNFEEFRKKFRHRAFRCVKIAKKRGWAGMLFKNRKSRR